MYQKTTLDNGLRLVTSQVPTSRSVCLAFFLGIGSRYEQTSESGISHFVEHLCFKGTKRRPSSREVCLAIEGVGGMLNGGTDKEATVYWCKVALPHFSLALDVLVDMLRSSLFYAMDVEKERGIIMEEIALSRDMPSQLVDLLIDEVLWPDQPLGRDVAGTRETVTTMERQRMLNHWAKYYVPGNTVVTVAGDVEHQGVLTQVVKALGDWSGRQKYLWSSSDNKQNSPRLRVEARDIEQTHLCLALRGLPANHPDRFTLDLLNVILGEGMTSRLFLEVRERLGLAYEVYSSINHFSDAGSLTIYAGVEPGRLETALGAIIGELARLRQDIPEEEIVKAKEFSKGRLLLRMEDTRSVAGWLGGQELLLERILTVDEVLAKIDAISPSDLKQMAQRLIIGDKLSLAVVGPVRQGEEHLQDLLKL